ncbi:2-hydroxyacid dehydrogenase [Formosa algae]|uniref:D-lactate dehydrogenase n=1 Tax=Formosa algae TaxID=225843 RepID=A0A9X0YGN8_9FLAO|nr:2-hydroxyacid dehydrogenase [Formosa algae]MBP1838200.1 D-lactate dehydrogenase [Formosa algae]MDQ0334335.1 D-lactate dehydrogenase [Formosa algae]OEI80716.1 hydroxyacid dehydrogenase [Formosa algae]
MKVAFFSTKSYDITSFEKHNTGAHDIIFYESTLNTKTAKLTQGCDAVCAFVNDHLHERTIKLLSEYGVKLIAMRCAGFNNVDLKAAKAANIKVVRVPAYSPMAVAEHATALIMTLNRKTHKAYNRVRDGNFSLERLTGFDMYGKTVGVIGTGKIGQYFSKIMLGFGCKIIAYDLYPNEELKALGVTYLSLDELLKSSNIISLHCPLTEDTHHLINEAAFSKMKKGTMLINTSRGGLINTIDAVEALKNQTLEYFGIDVYEQEEKLFFRDLSENIIMDDVISRLISFPNVIITSHQGFLTHEALDKIAEVTLGNLLAYQNEESLENEVVL